MLLFHHTNIGFANPEILNISYHLSHVATWIIAVNELQRLKP